MANTSFDTAIQLRFKLLEEFKDTEIPDRAAVDIVKEINLQRKSGGRVPLSIDENCMTAAADSFQNIGNLQSLVVTHNVVGHDFLQVFQEKQFNISSSLPQNQSIYEGFLQLLVSLDNSNKTHLMDEVFTHIGLAVRRSFGCFKLMAILFKKQLQILHLNLDLSTGINIQGRMLDPYSAIYLVVVKDGKEATTPVIAGPRRISLKSDLKDFEVIIPRLMLSQRSATEKLLEFYVVKTDPRSIGYNTGKDLNSLPSEALLCHKMAFTGLWESNIILEEKSSSDLQFLRDEYEAKNGSKLITHSANDFRSRGRGRGSLGTNTHAALNSTGRGEWNSRGTPWKGGISSRLSTIQEAPRETEVKKELWARDIGSKENNPFARDTSMNMSMSREQTTSSYSFPQRMNECSFPNVQPSPTNFASANSFMNGTTQPHNNMATSPLISQPAFLSNPFQDRNTGYNPSGSFQSNPGFHTAGQMFTSTTAGPGMYHNPAATNPMQGGMPVYQGTNTPGFSMHGNQMQNPFYSSSPSFQATGNNMGMNFGFQNMSNGVGFSNNTAQGPYSNPCNFAGSGFNTQFTGNPFFQNSMSIGNNPTAMHELQRGIAPSPLNLYTGVSGSTFNIPTPSLSSLVPTQSFYPIGNDEITYKKAPSGTFGVSKSRSEPSPPQNPEETKTKAFAKPPNSTSEVNIPCLILPIPSTLLAEIRKPRPENTSYTKLYSTMEYSDILLRVKDTEFKSHKAVLFSASSFFRDQLEKSKTFTTVQMSKIILPSWFSIEAFKLVLKFMYSCDLDKESINLSLAKEVLNISDHLQVQDLCEIVIVKYILTQVTRDDVLGILLQAFARNKELTEAWEYLIESCSLFAAQHSNWIVRNQRAECMSLPLSCVLKIVDYSMRFITSTDQIGLVIKLLTDMRYAECVFEVTNKVTDLFLSGYSGYPVDVRVLDYVKPLTSEQISKFDPNITMEYPLLEESTPWFGTYSRENPVPPPKISESINHTFHSGKTAFIVQPKDLVARSKPVFSFAIKDIFRPKNVMSACFATASRKWSVLISTSKELQLSVFLCERGPAERINDGNFTELLYTSVLFEIEIEDSGVTEALRNGNQPGFCAGFFCFANNQYQMAGERNYCKASSIRCPDSVKINVYLKEIGLHSGLLHYLCENFDTLLGKSPKKFTELSHFNLKYLLAQDLLPIAEEHEAAGALWKYAANKPAEIINLLVSEIRFQFLSTKDLLTLARDHASIRSTQNFKHLFRVEYFRRTEGKKVSEKPRRKYENLVEEINKTNYNEEIIDWVLGSQHHQGYEERIVDLKKKLEEEKAENNKKKAELNAKKHEMTLEYEKMNRELRQLKGYDNYVEFKPQETDPYYSQDKNCNLF